MSLAWVLTVAIIFSALPIGLSKNTSSSRPATVTIGAMFTFNSTIGRVAKVAIDAAVNDINANSTVLPGTNLVVKMQDTSCNGFIGMVEALQFMETDVAAIVGPQSSVIAHIVSHIANKLQVPILSFAATDPTLNSLEYPFFVRTTRSDLFQMAAIGDIVDYYQWGRVIAIYIDDEYGRNAIASLGDKLAEKRRRFSYKAPLPPGATENDIMNVMVKVALKACRVVVVHVNPDMGLKVFSIAKYLGMMNYGYVWIATDWLSSLIDSSAPLNPAVMDTMHGAIVLRQHTSDTKLKKDLASRWSQIIRKEQVEYFQLHSYGMYAYDSVWAIAHSLDAFFENKGNISFSEDPTLHTDNPGSLNLKAMTLFDGGKLLLDQVHKVDFEGVTGRIKFNSDGDLVQPAYDILNILGSGMRTIGYWSNYSGLTTVLPETLYAKPANRSSANQNLYSVIWPGEKTTKPRGWVFPNNGKELKIGVPDRASFKVFSSKELDSNTMKGFCIDVFIAAVNLLPYPVPYKLIPFGNGHDNPSYTKLVEKVASEELDAAIGDIAITTNRTRIVDFTQPFAESGLVIVAPLKKQNQNAFAFFQPFTLLLWCVTGLFFLTVGVVIWILEHRINDDFRGPPKKQLGTVFWFSFSTLFFSHRENTMSTLGRAVLLIWLFVVLIIQSSYTASLTSILTVQQLSSHIKGIESLMASDEPIGFQVGSFAENYLVNELNIARSRLRALGGPEEYEQALEKGPDNGGVSAVVDENAYVQLFLSTHCNFATVGSQFTKSGWGFAFQKDSPLAVDLSTAILSLSENGDLQRIHDKWLSTSMCSSQSNEIDSNRLQLSSFWGLFMICGMACTLSLLIYFFMMLRQYLRHCSFQETSSSGEGSSRSGISLQRFLSFIDEKEEEFKRKYKIGRTPETPENGLPN